MTSTPLTPNMYITTPILRPKDTDTHACAHTHACTRTHTCMHNATNTAMLPCTSQT